MSDNRPDSNDRDQEIKRRIYQSQLDHYRNQLRPYQEALSTATQDYGDLAARIKDLDAKVTGYEKAIFELLELARKEGVELEMGHWDPK